ncbi:prophage L54a, N-6-adenine-methyltransferase [Bifidobacterium breve DSM 20213 = JCM 1192]|uniref:Prophage L54a, N-6-adenine-methyltransferase n=1 Tax=Bifidobacterium breve DSM 20213 = JCM 1192 TaxID=518634 RepID=D4BRV3_BIFBR|nr:prophage L54a, N-6-adenine-methyltransferase [Bifidobacterium breve DSM 20213 = JCM 1192]
MSDFTGAGGAAYMSNRMNWETPQELFDQLDAEFHFTLDAASSATNHKCQKYYTAEDSAFDHEWGGGGRYSAILHTARQSRNGCANAAQKPAAKTPSSSCSCPLAPTHAGSNNSFSTVRRSGSSKADSGSRRTAYRAARRHSPA